MPQLFKEIIFIRPCFVEKLWGSDRLGKTFPFDIALNEKIGEAWLISAEENVMSYVINTAFAGTSLKQLWEKQPQLFGFPCEQYYPLLSKILNAEDHLSVQFHPDDAQAQKLGFPNGKTECWYVLDSGQSHEVIYGHHALNKKEFHQLLNEQNWSKLLKYKKIAVDDFIYVPSKKVHGLLAGTMVYELQQSSDITYRLYDYDRPDISGKLRKLDLDKVDEIIDAPDSDIDLSQGHDNYLVDNNFFKLIKITNQETQIYSYPDARWIQFTLLKGTGTIDGTSIKIGDSFILPHGYNKFTLEGEMLAMLSFC